MIFWDLYYWNKHEYCWKWIGMSIGDDARQAIRSAVEWLPTFAKSHMMKVVKYDTTRIS